MLDVAPELIKEPEEGPVTVIIENNIFKKEIIMLVMS
jgi:hypothetical protein